MNDDTVSECEIRQTKDKCGPVSESRFSQKFQQNFKPQCTSQSQCFYASQYGHNTIKNLTIVL
jgi:hypothetical protein